MHSAWDIETEGTRPPVIPQTDEMDEAITEITNVGEKRPVCRSNYLSITANYGVATVDGPLA